MLKLVSDRNRHRNASHRFVLHKAFVCITNVTMGSSVVNQKQVSCKGEGTRGAVLLCYR